LLASIALPLRLALKIALASLLFLFLICDGCIQLPVAVNNVVVMGIERVLSVGLSQPSQVALCTAASFEVICHHPSY